MFDNMLVMYISDELRRSHSRLIYTQLHGDYSILFYSKTSRLGRRKCQSTTRAPNNIVSVKSTIE